MILDDRLYVDNTLARSAMSCSMQLVLRHVLHWNTREASSYSRAGLAAHEALADWHRAPFEGATADEARERANARFAEEYKVYSDQWVAADDRMQYENLATILDEWLITRAGKLDWIVPSPSLVEVGFAYPLDTSGRVVAYGRMDVIARLRRDGSWVVVDHKTTGCIDALWVDSWALDPQVTHYFWAALQHVPDCAGFLVNGIEFSRLPSSDRKCSKHGLPYHQCARAHLHAQVIGPVTRTPEAIERWRLDVLRAAEKIQWYAETYDPAQVGTTPDLAAVEVEGPFTGACRFCAFRDWCRLGQQPAMLPTMFVQDEWYPYNPADYLDAESPTAGLGET